MNTAVRKIAALFAKMVKNHDSFGESWRNVALGREAFDRMKALPPSLKDVFDTPMQKAALLGRMLGLMSETLTPRFCIKVREYMRSLDADNPENRAALRKLEDFIDPDLPVEEYCRRYGCHLMFDPVERTPEWEETICEVEKACGRRLRRQRRRMGFCFLYWSVKREELARRGIEWRSPKEMNPRVLFD